MIKRRGQTCQCGFPVGRVHDQLGDHRVVVGRDGIAFFDAAVDAQARWQAERGERARRRGELHRRIFGVKPRLDRVAVDRQIVLHQSKARAFGNPQVKRDKVQPGDRFGDGMFHLNARVHLKEEILATRDQKFDRAQPAIVQRFAQAHRVACDVVQKRSGQTPGRGFLDDLLVAALKRAIAFEQVNHMPLSVTCDLHFDMAGLGQETFQQKSFGTEGGFCFAQRAFDVLDQRGFVSDEPLPSPTTAADRLEQHRQAHLAHLLGNLLGIGPRTFGARNHRDAGRHGGLFGAGLVAETFKRFRRRPHEDHAGGFDRTGKIGVFGQKAITGMDRIRAHRLRGGNHRVDFQIALGCRSGADTDRFADLADMQGIGVGLRMHADGNDTAGPRSARDPAGNFAAVGDQKRFDFHGSLLTS